MKPIILAMLAGLGWGIGELFTRSVLHAGKIGPLTAIAVRSTVALPLLWLAWFVAQRGLFGLKPEPPLSAADGSSLLKLVLGSGVIAGACGMIFFYTALSLGEISRVKPVAFSVAPAAAVLLGCFILGDEITLRKMAAISLILLGVILLTGK